MADGNAFKSTVIKAAEQILGHKARREVRKPWATDEMIDVMEEIRKWKSKRKPKEEGHKYIDH